MIDYAKFSQRLLLHEGLRLKPYYCTRGRQTIGIGRCIDTNPFTLEELKVVGDWQHGITKNAAFYLLHNDIERVAVECAKNIPFWANLNEDRQYALLDMAFQLGINGLLKFKRMLAQMGVGNYKNAAAECLSSNYAKQTPKRAQRIARTIELGKFEI